MTDGWFALYPPVGGGRGAYSPMVAELRDHGHCHLPALAGRDNRFAESAAVRFTDLADDLWTQLEAEFGPGRDPGGLVLFGFSMGALIATEMAARLQQRGTAARGLVVAGCPPPHLLAGHALHTLEDAALTAALAAQGTVPRVVLDDPGLLSMMLPVWRADCAAVASHPRRPVVLDCPVHALGGTEDPLVREADLTVWPRLGGAGSSVRMVPGDHAAVLDRQDLMAAAVLASADRSSPTEARW
ncbi:thioesterase II family protein [Streptomyces genisteinicus]|uniref:Thioesterase n=1 Tax=Streptomyces genisteinicus TaxID=2768068 RepID=A0A7H0I1H5_9ACTN|nr:alpha/beta fold hydrolase [Streptomyces genisteinicus]QNP66641.1 thioesterase [Streptomyces genisteinicus]